MPLDSQTRKQSLLDAAASLIIQYGYDKTTIGDVADAIGLNRALVYGYFKSKDDLLEAFVRREMHKYGELWFEHLMADPQGGTVASIYRSVAYALKNTPFMAAIVMRDQGTFGKYLRKPGNIFEGMQWMRSQTAWSAFPGQARLRHSMSCSKPSLKCSIGC